MKKDNKNFILRRRKKPHGVTPLASWKGSGGGEGGCVVERRSCWCSTITPEFSTHCEQKRCYVKESNSHAPQFRLFPPNVLSQTPQKGNRHQSDGASLRVVFTVYDLTKSKKTTGIVLIELLTCPAFATLQFGLGDDRVFPKGVCPCEDMLSCFFSRL